MHVAVAGERALDCDRWHNGMTTVYLVIQTDDRPSRRTDRPRHVDACEVSYKIRGDIKCVAATGRTSSRHSGGEPLELLTAQ